MAVGKNELTLELGKHFLIIDSNKSFILEDNQGFRAYRPAGAWQIDCWKLLPEQWHKIYPVYTLKIEWENSEADKDYIPTINATDLDLGDGIAGVSGQPVNVTTPVIVANLPNVIIGEQNTVPVHIETDLQPLEVVNHANNIIDGFRYVNGVSGIFDDSKLYKIFVKTGLIVFRSSSNEVNGFFVKDCVCEFLLASNGNYEVSGEMSDLLTGSISYSYYEMKNGRQSNSSMFRPKSIMLYNTLYKELD